MSLYTEQPGGGHLHRARFLKQIRDLVASERGVADACRAEFFNPDLSSSDAYLDSLVPYRERFKALLGWPLTTTHTGVPTIRRQPLAEDDHGRLFRIWINTLPALETYGLLLLPYGKEPFPLVICQHGGGGIPEACCGLIGTSIYNNIPRRILQRNCAVFAPQSPMWGDAYGPAVDRVQLDRQLKHLGGSAAALYVRQLSRSLDALSILEEIDDQRIGMTGLSWGGFNTLIAAAIDTRIKVALTSCFFNNRYTYDLAPALWLGAARSFMDAEIASLVCPRPLCIETGKHDDEFAVEDARPEAEKVAARYRALGLDSRFRYHEHERGHEFDKSDHGIEFVVNGLEHAGTQA